MGIGFYELYINKTYRLTYLDDGGNGLKPKHFLPSRMIYTSGGDAIQEMWYRYRKIARDNFGRKRKSTGYIYLPGLKFREAEGHLSMRSCLQDDLIHMPPGLENTRKT